MTTVVAGILKQEGRILICRRRADQTHPLKWEFPGGKVEPGESEPQALVRELNEELGIATQSAREITRYEFAYPGKNAILLVFLRVVAWTGDVENRIFEAIAWETPERLGKVDFLEGDEPFISQWLLPAGN